jgi:hypothetical protein
LVSQVVKEKFRAGSRSNTSVESSKREGWISSNRVELKNAQARRRPTFSSTPGSSRRSRSLAPSRGWGCLARSHRGYQTDYPWLGRGTRARTLSACPSMGCQTQWKASPKSFAVPHSRHGSRSECEGWRGFAAAAFRIARSLLTVGSRGSAAGRFAGACCAATSLAVVMWWRGSNREWSSA